MSSFRYAHHISRACSPRGRPMRRAFEAPLLASLAAPSRRPFTTTSAAPLERKAKMPLPIGSSLKVPHPDTPALRPPSAFKPTYTRITTLPNGVRVASEETYGQASCVGVFVNGGSRNETLETNGTTHLLQRMGYKVQTCSNLVPPPPKPWSGLLTLGGGGSNRPQRTGQVERSCELWRIWGSMQCPPVPANAWFTPLK